MSDTPSGIFKRTAEVKVPVSALIQAVLTIILGWMFSMMLGMDARVARIEASKLERDKAIDAALAKVEKEQDAQRDARQRQWDAIRELRGKR